MQTMRTNCRNRIRAAGKITHTAADADSSKRTGDDVEEIIDALYGRRTSAATREAALAALIHAMEGFVPAHDMEHAEDILSRCIISIKRGSTTEACLALRAAALLAVTLDGEGPQDIMRELYPHLTRILHLSSEPDASGAKVMAALDCLAVVTFTGAATPDETEASLKVMWGLIHPQSGPKLAGSSARKPSPQELAAAVSAWTFVLTRATPTAAGGWMAKPMDILATLLYAEDRAVRIAAGAALAVCVELKLLPSKNKKSDMVARMSDLAIEAAGTGVDKKGFLEQKDLFKQLSAFMAHGKRPERSVRTSSSQRGLLKVSTWSDVVRLKFLRRFLGPGFLHHLQGHGLMREVFDVKDQEITGKRLSAALWKTDLLKRDPGMARELLCESMDQKNRKEERKIWSGLEKRRTLTIKKDRRIANEVKYGAVGDKHVRN